MAEAIGLLILLAIGGAIASLQYLLGIHPHPGEKRTYLFETPDGEKANPFEYEENDEATQFRYSVDDFD